MPRRNLVPLVLLAVLAVLALAFAVLGASSAPSGATLTVQNGVEPRRSARRRVRRPSRWTWSRRSPRVRAAATVSQVRQIRYVPPQHMAVYQVTSNTTNTDEPDDTTNTTRLLGSLNLAAITCALSSYTAIVGGAHPVDAQRERLRTHGEPRRLLGTGARRRFDDLRSRIRPPCTARCTSARSVRAGYLVGDPAHRRRAAPRSSATGPRPRTAPRARRWS